VVNEIIKEIFMKRVFLTGCILIFLAGYCMGSINDDLEHADTLHDGFRYTEENTLLLSLLNKARGDKEKAEVYWRLARVHVYLGDASEDAGDPKGTTLSIFEQGEEYADKSIQLNPGNHLGYYWKSGNIGRWGQVKGILNALAKAKPMKILLVQAININPNHADSFHVLGELYDELPGFPVSFGNIDSSVSLARKCIALHEMDRATGREVDKRHDYYIKLAKHLHKRNWDAEKRNDNQPEKKKKYNKENDILEKNFYFEGTLSLKNMPDRNEAEAIINEIIAELEGMAHRNKQQNDHLADAKELKAGW
jgi:tetratricopeptide (TPR) repeat protein